MNATHIVSTSGWRQPQASAAELSGQISAADERVKRAKQRVFDEKTEHKKTREAKKEARAVDMPDRISNPSSRAFETLDSQGRQDTYVTALPFLQEGARGPYNPCGSGPERASGGLCLR